MNSVGIKSTQDFLLCANSYRRNSFVVLSNRYFTEFRKHKFPDFLSWSKVYTEDPLIRMHFFDINFILGLKSLCDSHSASEGLYFPCISYFLPILFAVL